MSVATDTNYIADDCYIQCSILIIAGKGFFLTIPKIGCFLPFPKINTKFDAHQYIVVRP